MIKVKAYANLDSATKQELLLEIDGEFGHIPIVKETEWAAPDWTIIYYKGDDIVTFCNVVERNVILDGDVYQAGGINNLITPKKYRGNGFATKTMKRSEELIFQELNCKIGLLLCADALIPYYEKLSWYKVEAEVIFKQKNEQKIWSANLMLKNNGDKLRPTKIDLNGLPW